MTDIRNSSATSRRIGRSAPVDGPCKVPADIADLKRTCAWPRDFALQLCGGNSFDAHVLLVLSGHRKLSTRLVHIVTSHGMCVALLYVAHALTGVPLPFLLVLLWAAYVVLCRRRLVVATWSAVWIAWGAAAFAARMHSMPGSRSILTGLATFLAFGVPEHLSHRLFDDGDRNLVTRHCNPGRDKAQGIVCQVLLPAPLCFWYLLFSDVLEVVSKSGFPVSGEIVGVQPMGVLQQRAGELLRHIDMDSDTLEK